MERQISKLGLLVALAIVAVGCAKEKKYESVTKDNVFAKSAISTDPNDPYVYVPSTGDTPMQVTASRSYWLGDHKLATFKFEENELVAVQLPDDERFAGNSTNQSPILRIPIEYKDYECKKDQYGKCSNQEVEADRTWGVKKFFRAKFDDIKINETNTLPEQLTNLFGNCYGEPNTVVKDVKIEADAVNLHIQKTWKANIFCAGIESFSDLRNLSFTVNYFYSFVKLSTLTKNRPYEPVTYPFEDQNTFGFFKTDKMTLSPDGRNLIRSNTTYLNRWDPNKAELVYNLSEGFYAPGMESIRAATDQAVTALNNSLDRAGVATRIKLQDGRGKSTGDLRNNFLILVSDPQSSGVIGYGPTVANPRTGEILKGHVAMYYGSMKRMIQDTYEEIIAERQRNAQAAQSEGAAIAVNDPQGQAANPQLQQRLDSSRALLSKFTIARPAAQVSRPAANIDLASPALAASLKKELFSADRQVDSNLWLAKLQDAKASDMAKARAQVELNSRQCFYHQDMVNWEATVGSAITEDELGVSELKPWLELTEDEQQQIIDKLMPLVWVPTLVHEMGHNLGLRHNFSGSEDADNFYNAAEIRSLGLSRTPVFASVMDYSARNLNELPTMGKYDIAALRFAYKRELTKKDGTSAAIPAGATFEAMKSPRAPQALKDLKASLRDFKYCTDEHTSVNANCNRFDEGTDLKAIAEHYVKTYKDKYAKRNYRNNRHRFSILDDRAYFSSIDYTFDGLRAFFELFDRISNKYPGIWETNWDQEIQNAPDDATRAIMRENQKFFASLHDATKVAADFFLEVLTTPDLGCVIVQKSNPRQIFDIVPPSVFGDDVYNCFDSENIQLKPEFAIVGEVGKYFNHQRHKAYLPGELVASSAELSVRGIWMDKLLAAQYLNVRELDNPIYDDYRSNFLDYKEFSDKIRPALVNLLTGKLDVQTDVRLANGSTVKLQNVFDIGDSHVIKNFVSTSFHERLGLDRVMKDIRDLIIPYFKTGLARADNVNSTLGLYNALSVIPLNPVGNYDLSQIAETAEFRDANGLFIAKFAATKDQTTAVEMMKQRALRKVIEGFERAQIVTVFQQKVQNKVPAEIPENLKPLYDQTPETLVAFLSGQMLSDEYLVHIFGIMAN